MTLLLALYLSLAASAESLSGKVTSIRDGSTIELKDDAGNLHQLRLLGILVPTAGGYGQDAARNNLEQLILDKSVTFNWEKEASKCKDGAKCIKAGKLLLDGQDINLKLINVGYARHDKSAMAYQSTPDRTTYTEAEDAARKSGLGFWNQTRRPASVP